MAVLNWLETPSALIRIHVVPRKVLFTPHDWQTNQNTLRTNLVRNLGSFRTTCAVSCQTLRELPPAHLWFLASGIPGLGFGAVEAGIYLRYCIMVGGWMGGKGGRRGEIVLSADPARAVYVQSPMHGVHTWHKVLVWTPETLRASQTLACLAVCTSVRTVTP